jgi:hypothetical protein
VPPNCLGWWSWLGQVGSLDQGEIGTGSGRGGRVGGRWRGRLVGRSVIKFVSVRPLRGRDLAKGRADPRGSPNSTVRGKQTAQTANAVRLR